MEGGCGAPERLYLEALSAIEEAYDKLKDYPNPWALLELQEDHIKLQKTLHFIRSLG